MEDSSAHRYRSKHISFVLPRRHHAHHATRRAFAATAWLCKKRGVPKTLAPPEKPEPTQRTTPSVSSAPAPKEGKWANEIGSEEWREYDPDKGIPRPEGDLTQAEITTILGPGVDAKTGNWILRVLQYRRLSGSLADEGITFPEGRGFARELPLRGLEYLRANYPVDEEAAATRWADEEAAMLEDMLVKDAERLGLYKKEEEPQQGTEFGQRYGQSGLDAIKKHYESQPVKERKSQADEIRENTGTLQTVGNRAELTTGEKPLWWKKYEEQAVISKEKTVPHIGTFKRLFPSFLVTITTLALCIAFSQLYTPPPRSARLWPDTPPAAATCIGILLANAAVLLLWRFPPAWRFLNRYTLVAPGYPIAMSMIGNVFSHQQFSHFFWNMLLLMIVGTQLHEQVGRGDFLALYLASGVAGSFSSLCWYVLRGNFATVSLGASGAMAGAVAALCLVSPGHRFSVPLSDYSFALSTHVFLAALVGMELLGMFSGKTKVDHVSHLGGYAMGVLGALAFRRQLAERRRVAEERKREMSFLKRPGEGR